MVHTAHTLPADWLPAAPDVVARLESLRRPRVADVGCGQGFSTVAVARAFLDGYVDGFDRDADAIAEARAHAAHAGLDGRVRFLLGDSGGLAASGPYDLVLLQALHARGDPVGALRAARAALSAGATVLAAAGGAAATARELAAAAGYARARVLAVDHHALLYRLDP